MKIHFTGRQTDVSDAMKRFVTERLEKVTKYLSSVQDVTVTLSVEKYRQIAEICVQSKPFPLNGMEVTNDMHASVSAVLDKLERQARKQKEKVRDRKKRGPNKEELLQQLEPSTGAEEGVDSGDGGEEVEEEEEEEPAAGAAAPQGAWRPPGIPVVRSETSPVQPLSLEEAARQLHDSTREFLVYRDSRNGRINVLYRRSGGDLGLIDPDA
jgi:putative sigma-54 modulation protein